MATERMIDGETRVADAVVAVLADAGVRFVVGIPGGFTGTLFRSLYEHPSIRTVLVREESIGSAMADAYGRTTGEPMVVMGQGEWIVGNAGQGLLEASLGASPVVVLTDLTDAGVLSHHGPYQDGSGNYGNWDTKKALEAVCKRVMVSHFPAQSVQMVQLALKHALTGEQGPAAVVFHSDSLRGRLTEESVPTIYPVGGYLPRPSHAVDGDLVGEVARVVHTARRPVIVAGNGVRVGKARAELARFARTCDVPVVTTASGKGVFPEIDPLAGGVMGAFGWQSANDVVADSDVVVAVGTKLGPSDTGDEHEGLLSPGRQTIVQIDVEPLNIGWTYPVDHAIVGDARAQLAALVESFRALGPVGRTVGAAERVADARAASPWFGRDTARTDDDGTPSIHPPESIGLLAETVPDDTIVTCDAGENRLFMMQWFRVPSRGEYLQPAAGGGMGYAIPAALGARLAHPDRPVVAVCGDGGFGMSLHSLMTAVQEQLPITVVVLNNGALGWVAHGMGERAVASHFAPFDHAAIARAIGCEAIHVRDSAELESALRRIPDITVPFVIDVPTSMAISFKDVMSTFSSATRRGTGY